MNSQFLSINIWSHHYYSIAQSSHNFQIWRNGRSNLACNLLLLTSFFKKLEIPIHTKCYLLQNSFIWLNFWLKRFERVVYFLIICWNSFVNKESLSLTHFYPLFEYNFWNLHIKNCGMLNVCKLQTWNWVKIVRPLV